MWKKTVIAYLIVCFCWPAGLAYGRTLPQAVLQSMIPEGADVSAPVVNALPGAVTGDFVRVGEATLEQTGNTLVIDQKTAKLLLEWATFDIGGESTVHFKQDVDATAVNVINDAKPSKIFGRLVADGQIYLLNQNGVIFGEHSSVNVRGMIAAAAQLNGYEDVAQLSEQQKLDFLQNSLLDVIGDGKALLVVDEETIQQRGVADLPRIIVKQGAKLQSDDAPILLAGPEVINEGDILSRNGQVVLAGSRKDVYLAVSDQDEDLRGYLVEVDSGSGEQRGKVSNAGAIVSTLGNVTLVADEIIQAGKIKATTAVDVNGSIRIMARDQAREVGDYSSLGITSEYWSAANFDVGEASLDRDGVTGTVNSGQRPSSGKAFIGREGGTATFTEGSVTEVVVQNLDAQKLRSVLERNNLDPVAFHKQSEAQQIRQLRGLVGDTGVSNLIKTATDSLAQPDSRLHVAGKTITLESGSELRAKGGEQGGLITLVAREDPLPGASDVAEDNSSASITLREGAVVDASGTDDTVLDADRNVLTTFITSNEVKNNPNQKGGNLLRKEVAVDIREGTELFDWEAGLETVERSASERSVHGGRVTLSSTGSIDIEANASVDVSGGEVAYRPGYVETSKVMVNGRLLDIADAPATAPINAVVGLNLGTADDAKWGERSSFSPISILLQSTRYYDAYNQGYDAGSMHLVANEQSIDPQSSLLAGVRAGEFQLNANQPRGGNIRVDIRGLEGDQNIYLSDQPQAVAEDTTALYIDKGLIADSGAQTFSVEGNQLISLLAGDTLDLGPRQGLNLVADSIVLAGDIRSRGGDVTAEASATLDILGAVDTSGTWANQLLDPKSGSVTEAGNMGFAAGDSLIVHQSASLKANAGAYLGQDEKLRMGKAGSIALDITEDGRPGEFLEDSERPAVAVLGEIEAMDAGVGGTLSLVVSDLTIDGTSSRFILDEGGEAGAGATIGDRFFSRTRVGHFDITAKEGDILVQSDADIRLLPNAFYAAPDARLVASSDRVDDAYNRRLLPAYMATGGAISLRAERTDFQSDRGNIQVQSGARFRGPRSAALSLIGDESLVFDGRVEIAGGRVTLGLEQFVQESTADRPDFNNRIIVGENAAFELGAASFTAPGRLANVSSDVTEAGSLSLLADVGYVLVDENARIDLSGGLFQGQELINGELRSLSRPVAGGEFRLHGESGFAINAGIDFGDPGQGYAGGAIRVSLDDSNRRWNSDDQPQPHAMIIGDDAAGNEDSPLSALAQLGSSDYQGSGSEALNALAGSLAYRGYLGRQTLQNGHLRSLALNTNRYVTDGASPRQAMSSIEVLGDSALQAAQSIVLDTPVLDLGGHRLALEAGYIQLGDTDNTNNLQAAVNGGGVSGGELTLKAGLVDVAGDLMIQGDERIAMEASRGLRLRSVILNDQAAETVAELVAPTLLQANGDMTLATPVVWAASLADGTIATQGRLALESVGNNDDDILAAGSALRLQGDSVRIDTRVVASYGDLSVVATGTPATDTPPTDAPAVASAASAEVQPGDIILGANARLEVGSDRAVPLGRLEAGDVRWDWSPVLTPVDIASQDSMPLSKTVSLDGVRVLADANSIIDLSGGGGVYGREFEAGLEGTEDLLSGAHYTERFAIVPTMTSGYAPYDPVEFAGSGLGSNWGLQFEVAGSSQLASGSYTVLPANYALVPGAYLITPKSGDYVNRGFTTVDMAGVELVSGRLQQARDSSAGLWTRFMVEPGSQVSRYGTYNLTYTDNFFNAKNVQLAPGQLTSENGGVSINVDAVLDLESRLVSSDQSAVGSYLDITSSGPIHVGGSESATGLFIDGSLFSDTSVSSILLGANRQWQDGAWGIADTNAVSSEVELAESFTVNELMVVARDAIQLAPDSQVVASGETQVRGNQWNLAGIGVAALASNAGGSGLQIDDIGDLQGQVGFAEGSSLAATGTLGIAYGSVAAGAGAENAIQTGALDATDARLQILADGLVIGDSDTDNVSLASGVIAGAAELELYSDEVITFASDLDISNNTSLFAGRGLAVAEGVTVKLASAETLQLRSRGDGAVASAPAANSTLQLRSAVVGIGAAKGGNSDFTLGAQDVLLQASDVLTLSGDLALQGGGSAGGFTLETPLIGSLTANSEIQVTTPGQLSVDQQQGAAIDDLWLQRLRPANRFAFEGSGVQFNTMVSNRSGMTQLAASAGSLQLGSDTVLDLSAFSQEFPQETLYGPAGVLRLSASEDLTIADADIFEFGTAVVPADAGAMTLLAGGTLTLQSERTRELGQGGIDLTVVAGELGTGDQNIATLNALVSLNAQGADGVLAWYLTQPGAQLRLAEGQDLVADNLALYSVRGGLAVDSELVAGAATRDLILFGEQGVSVGGNAILRVDSADNHQQALVLQGGNGLVDLAASATLDLSHGLDLILPAALATDVNQRVRIDATDRLDNGGGEGLSLFLSTEVEASRVTANDIDQYLDASMLAAEQALASDYISLLDAGPLPVSVRPRLDLFSGGDLTVGAVGQPLDLFGFKGTDGRPGQLVLRSGGQMQVAGGISDGIRKLVSVFDASSGDYTFSYGDSINSSGPGTPVLSGTDSADISLTAGAFTDSASAVVDPFNDARLTLERDAFLRTGTGDLQLAAAGDLTLNEGAYVATLGRSQALDQAGFPAWGDKAFYSGFDPGSDPSLWLIYGNFGGFGVAAGDVNLRVQGDIEGNSGRSSVADYVVRYATNANADVFGIDYSNITTWYTSIADIDHGVLSSGGGNLHVDAAGDILTTGFATPDSAIWYSDAVNNQGENLKRIAGGVINVSAGGDILGSSFHNDGTSVSVLARGAIAEADENGAAAMVSAASSQVELTAIGRMVLEGMVNSSIAPYDTSRFAAPFLGAQAINSDFGGKYFSGYDSTRLHLRSVADEVRLKGDLEWGGAFSQYFSGVGSTGFRSMLAANYMLPANVTLESLAADVVLDSRAAQLEVSGSQFNIDENALTLFPATDSRLRIMAAGSILSGDQNLIVYIPDFASSELPSLEQTATNLNTADQVAGLLFPHGFLSGNTTLNHSANLVQRPQGIGSQLVALTGDIGKQGSILTYQLPHAVSVFAGNDIVNTTFLLQHSSANDLSSIVANNDFRYILRSDGTGTGLQTVQVAGPGDLLLQTGGDIDLGASRGIRSIGNADNRVLGPGGASVHLYAGVDNTIYSTSGDYGLLAGTAMERNSQSPLFRRYFSDQEIDQATFIDLALAVLERGAGASDSEDIYDTLTGLISSATGTSVTSAAGARADFLALDTSLQQRLAVKLVAQSGLVSPDTVVPGAGTLFSIPEVGAAGLQAGAERTRLFQEYFAASGGFLSLDGLQSESRAPDLISASDNISSLEQLSRLPASEQVSLALAALENLDAARQLLVAESVMLAHNEASAAEGSDAGSAVFNFERGYVAQRLLFGSDYDFALRGMALKAALIQLKQSNTAGLARLQRALGDFASGQLDRSQLDATLQQVSGVSFAGLSGDQIAALLDGVEELDNSNLGGPGSAQASSLNQVLGFWEADSGLDFAINSLVQGGGDIDLRFSTIQTQASGDISLFTPAGSADVGVSASLVESLGLGKTSSELGIFTLARGDIGSIVANAFNVNESRTIPAAGGSINLWSAFGDIDAGRGAKTAVATPPTRFDVNPDTGAITFIVPPTTTGSGIQTRASSVSTTAQLTPSQRYFTIAEGVGSISLATPLGIVDAGEAGIQSAGDLFLGAAKVSGADNISVGGISTGVPTTTSIGSDIGGLGAAVDAATSSIQESAEKAASDRAQRSTAFVTIELL